MAIVTALAAWAYPGATVIVHVDTADDKIGQVDVFVPTGYVAIGTLFIKRRDISRTFLESKTFTLNPPADQDSGWSIGLECLTRALYDQLVAEGRTFPPLG